nr:uncharacterized protein LOC111514008 [Leptinotarsa decemlineata]
MDLIRLLIISTGVTLFMMSNFTQVKSLIAYDCDDKATEISAISIRDVAECPETQTAYQSESGKVSVLQRDEISFQHVWSCLIEVTRVIMHCGMHSHSSIVSGGILNYVNRIGADECRNAHRYRSLIIHHQKIGDLAANGTTTASLTLEGLVNADGSCEGTTYHENGQSWKSIIILATVKIRLMDYEAKIKLDENEIVLTGNVVCPYLKGYCFDPSVGEAMWETNPLRTCEDKLSLLYSGQADKIINQITTERLIVVENNAKVFAVTLIKRVNVCNMELWQTEHPRIIVAEETSQYFNLKPKVDILPHNADLMAYVNSKFLYVEQAYNRKIDQLYTDTAHRRCLTQREILRTRLLLAPLAPSTLSQLVKENGGYIGRVLGEILYIMRCIPRTVEIYRTNKCYNELPIVVNNRTKFMAPVTRIIQEHAEEVDCNGLMPPLYFIDDQWIGLTPYPIEKHAPEELSPEVETKLNFYPIQPVGALGIYTQEEIKSAQRIIAFGNERKAVENIIVRRVAGLETTGQGFSTVNLFDIEEMEKLAHNTMQQIWGWFTDIGLFMSGLMGFYAVFRIIKYALGVVLNGIHIYQTVGCGVMILASLWNTLTMWVSHRYQKVVAQDITEPRRDEEAYLEEADVPQRLYPRVPHSQHWTDESNQETQGASQALRTDLP